MKNTFAILLLYLPAVLFAQSLTLEDIFGTGKYREKRPEHLRFLNDDAYYTVQENNVLLKKETRTGKIVDTVVSKIDTLLGKKFMLSGYQFSDSEEWLLLSGNPKPLYRRSYTADYVLFDRRFPKGPQRQGVFKKRLVLSNVSFATFSPDGNKIGYVKDNNLFYFDIPTQTHVPVTNDGRRNEILNGSTDWVYEEEFEFTKAFFWSPDSKRLAFYRFDERQVQEYNMQKWEGLYPIDYRFKYPKAGGINSKVTIQVADLSSGTLSIVPLDTISGYYIPRVTWSIDANVLSLQLLNRSQTQKTIAHYHIISKEMQTLWTESGLPVEIRDDVLYYSEDNRCVTTTENEGVNTSFLWLNKGKTYSAKLSQISRTNAYLEKLDAIDVTHSWLYYTFSQEGNQKKLARISLKSQKTELLTLEKGNYSIEVSGKGNFYIITHSSSDNPSTVTLYDAKAKKLLRVLEDNASLRSILSPLNLPKQEFFSFQTTQNVELKGWILKPSIFDSTKKYPVIQFVYGGPGHQLVLDAWMGTYYLWHQYLASQGFVVVCVDGRGTGGRGTEFRTCTYRRLGELETIDQLETTQYLGNLPFVDKERIGVWGWSYGGYMSTNCLLLGNELYKAAIAVAPVTNWRFYDSIYTERYLSTPKDNAKGYDANSPVNYADKLKGHYLLIHGTSDDNVHIQHTYAMQEALVKAGKQFNTFIYPNKAHGLSGGNTRLHLYTMMAQFWKEKLTP